MAPSHEEVLQATAERAGAMQGLVADICAQIPVGDFPEPPVAALFANGATPRTAAAAAAATSAGLPPVVAAALAGGVVGALVAAAVSLLLLGRHGK